MSAQPAQTVAHALADMWDHADKLVKEATYGGREGFWERRTDGVEADDYSRTVMENLAAGLVSKPDPTWSDLLAANVGLTRTTSSPEELRASLIYQGALIALWIKDIDNRAAKPVPAGIPNN